MFFATKRDLRTKRSSRGGAITVLLLTTLTRCSGTDDSPTFAPEIRAQDLSQHTRTLASDAFGGRPPSGPDAQKVIEYLEGQLERLGLSPTFGDSYRQPVPLVSITASPSARLSITDTDTSHSYAYGDEMMVWTKRVAQRAELDGSELVFVGYGIDAPERDWNDYAGIDMAGKTAVILINDPGFATQDPDLFDGNAMTYYGRWTYKYEEAARQGAAGALIVHETAPATYGWSVVENSWAGPQFDLVREDDNMSRIAVEGWVQRDVALEIFEAAGLDFEELKQSALTPDFEAVPLGSSASVVVENTLERSETQNVAGTLTGSERPDEHVLYTAHWDHLGRGRSVDGDAIYNGAADNATGVAAVLEIAARFASETPERSVTFLFVGAEEQGLLGSYHYAENPAYPLAKTAALINVDVLLPMGETTDVSVIGEGSSELEEYLEDAAAEQARSVTPYPNPERGFYFRSDHFAFARKGVPALYLDSGTEHVERGADYITERKDHYNENVYHTPSDEWQEDWDWTGVVMDTRLMYDIGWRVANTTDWPEWYEGNPFRSVRQQSADERQP